MHNLVTATVLSVSAIALPLAAQAQDGCKLDKSEHVFSQAPNGPLKTHVFSPPGTKGKPRPAIVIFHGGGWVMGDPSWSFWLTDRFACKGMVTIVAQYRLSDQKTASPAEAIDDARAAIDWTRAHAKEFNIDPTRVAALGWSAGAHLAASAAVFATDKTQSPDLLALVSPAVSVVEDNHFRALFPPGTKIEDFSPAEHVRPGLPPTVMVTGRTDTVTPLAGVTKFQERMLAAGNVSVLHVYDDVGHLFTPAGHPDDGFPKPDQAVQAEAYEAIDRFLIEQGYLPAKR
ncbi:MULTISPECIES: alpha/beta hydrolase [Asticcacaulis]|uniref:alpha/beta hydrolase n=1 Tax=Asticcacaulis TaxID=76890 RepID=UPI001AE603DD|nr:alpha/beta hydrolase [Asticcacaulis sp. BE141]MBP2160501.1 acetyl esterase/lipase [Asticcacaulis solisilvae]MDR6801546.1 acetyl esterase/lipase [Asticcacaulis sp. BE141]